MLHIIILLLFIRIGIFRPILQFCAIQRKDNNEWAIPGGFVDPGEPVSQTLRREFAEEALNSLKHTGR